EDGAGALELPDRGGVDIERLPTERRGAPARGGAGGGQQILGTVRDPVQGPAIVPPGDLLLRSSGGGEAAIAENGHHRVVPRPELVQPLEEQLGERDRRDSAGANAGRQLAHGSEDDVRSRHGSPRYGAKGWKGSSSLRRRMRRSARAPSTMPRMP